jgi:hypothetical protein
MPATPRAIDPVQPCRLLDAQRRPVEEVDYPPEGPQRRVRIQRSSTTPSAVPAQQLFRVPIAGTSPPARLNDPLPLGDVDGSVAQGRFTPDGRVVPPPPHRRAP